MSADPVLDAAIKADIASTVERFHQAMDRANRELQILGDQVAVLRLGYHLKYQIPLAELRRKYA